MRSIDRCDEAGCRMGTSGHIAIALGELYAKNRAISMEVPSSSRELGMAGMIILGAAIRAPEWAMAIEAAFRGDLPSGMRGAYEAMVQRLPRVLPIEVRS